MSQSMIGAQVYTVRDHTKTPSDIAKSFARIKKIGYDVVEVSALGPIEISELVRILDGEGLTCAATHMDLAMMQDVAACVDYLEALGCKYPAIGGVEEIFKADSIAPYHEFARRFSRIAEPLAAQGLKVGYHNHSHELAHYDGAIGLDVLINECGPGVWFEIDTYWIAHGGGDPATWIEKVKGRIPCVHFKDMGITPSREHKMMEIGDGNLNWPRILEACRAAEVQWYVVERDAGDMDPFDSLQRSLDNLRGMGLS